MLFISSKYVITPESLFALTTGHLSLKVQMHRGGEVNDHSHFTFLEVSLLLVLRIMKLLRKKVPGAVKSYYFSQHGKKMLLLFTPYRLNKIGLITCST